MTPDEQTEGERGPFGFRWLRPPRLQTEEETSQSRHATWLEHFFDLVYVVAVAALVGFLHEDLTPLGFARFAFLFLPVWWAWEWLTYYADQFDTDDLIHRLAMAAGMFGTIVLALKIPNAFQGSSAAFAAAYVALRALTIGLYLRAWYFVPEARGLTGRFIIGFSIAMILWLVSIAVPEPARFALWGVALLISLATALISYLTVRHVPAQISHMPERWGLFAIFVLGESVIAVAMGVAEIQWRWQGALAAVFGFIIAVCLWWLYFERVDFDAISRAVTRSDRALVLAHIYGWSHYLVYTGIAAASAGILASVEASATGDVTLGGRLALCGGIAMYLLGITVNHWAAPHSLQRSVIAMRLILAALLVALVLLGGPLSPALLVVLVALLLLGLIVFETIRGAS